MNNFCHGHLSRQCHKVAGKWKSETSETFDLSHLGQSGSKTASVSVLDIAGHSRVYYVYILRSKLKQLFI